MGEKKLSGLWCLEIPGLMQYLEINRTTHTAGGLPADPADPADHFLFFSPAGRPGGLRRTAGRPGRPFLTKTFCIPPLCDLLNRVVACGQMSRVGHSDLIGHWGQKFC